MKTSALAFAKLSVLWLVAVTVVLIIISIQIPQAEAAVLPNTRIKGDIAYTFWGQVSYNPQESTILKRLAHSDILNARSQMFGLADDFSHLCYQAMVQSIIASNSKRYTVFPDQFRTSTPKLDCNDKRLHLPELRNEADVVDLTIVMKKHNISTVPAGITMGPNNHMVFSSDGTTAVQPTYSSSTNNLNFGHIWHVGKGEHPDQRFRTLARDFYTNLPYEYVYYENQLVQLQRTITREPPEPLLCMNKSYPSSLDFFNTQPSLQKCQGISIDSLEAIEQVDILIHNLWTPNILGQSSPGNDHPFSRKWSLLNIRDASGYHNKTSDMVLMYPKDPHSKLGPVFVEQTIHAHDKIFDMVHNPDHKLLSKHSSTRMLIQDVRRNFTVQNFLYAQYRFENTMLAFSEYLTGAIIFVQSTILATRNGFIGPELLSDADLKSIYFEVVGDPMPLSNLTSMRKDTKVTLLTYQNTVYLLFTIPIYFHTYDLIQTTAIPVVIQNRTVIPVLDSNYYLISSDKRKYTPLTDIEFGYCVGHRACFANTPLMPPTESHCPSAYYFDHVKSHNCTHQLTRETLPFFVNMHNVTIYSTDSPINLLTQCNIVAKGDYVRVNVKQPASLNKTLLGGMGFFTTRPGCFHIVENHHIVITPSHNPLHLYANLRPWNPTPFLGPIQTYNVYSPNVTMDQVLPLQNYPNPITTLRLDDFFLMNPVRIISSILAFFLTLIIFLTTCTVCCTHIHTLCQQTKPKPKAMHDPFLDGSSLTSIAIPMSPPLPPRNRINQAPRSCQPSMHGPNDITYFQPNSSRTNLFTSAQGPVIIRPVTTSSLDGLHEIVNISETFLPQPISMLQASQSFSNVSSSNSRTAHPINLTNTSHAGTRRPGPGFGRS